MGVICLLKCSVAPIDVQTIGRLFNSRFEVVKATALHEISIEVAVAIEVGQRCPTSNDFREQVSAGKSGLMMECDSSDGGFFAEPGIAAVNSHRELF